MIIEWFFSVIGGIGEWLVGLFPVWEPPAFFLDLDTQVNTFFAGFDGLGVWADWAFIGICVSALVAVWLIGLGIKVFRAAASYFLPGWGSG